MDNYGNGHRSAGIRDGQGNLTKGNPMSPNFLMNLNYSSLSIGLGIEVSGTTEKSSGFTKTLLPSSLVIS